MCLKRAALGDNTLLCKMSQPHPTMVLHNNWRQSVFLPNTSSSSAPASSPHDFLEHVGQNCPCSSTPSNGSALPHHDLNDIGQNCQDSPFHSSLLSKVLIFLSVNSKSLPSLQWLDIHHLDLYHHYRHILECLIA